MPTKTDGQHAHDTALKQKPKFPRKFKVILLNDDVTHMEFVVDILMEIFHHDMQSAVNVMLKIHNEGSGVAGIYPKQIAENKQDEALKAAASAGFPLRVTIEEE